MQLYIKTSTGEVGFLPYPTLTNIDEGYEIVEMTPEIQAVMDSDPPEGKWSYFWDGSALIKAPVPPSVPESITAWQAKAALAMTPNQQAGTMLAAAEAVINAMPDGPEQTVVRAAWDNNANFSRTSPTILSFAAALGLTNAELDQLFILGDSLTV